MGLDLRDGLRDLVEDPRVQPAPVPVGAVAARVRRGRAQRWARVGLAGVSAAAVVGLGVVALGGGPGPVVPADPAPSTVEPAPAPTPEPTGEPAPDPTGEPAPDSLSDLVPVVLDEPGGNRSLVLVRPGGGVAQTLLTDGNLWPGPATATPDRSWVYATRASGDMQQEVLRVSADGTVEVVGTGRMPSVSPDGTTLAYVGVSEGSERATIVVADLDGTVRRTIDDEAYDIERTIDPVAWLPDGRMLLAHGSTDAFELGGTLTVLDEETETVQSGANLAIDGFRLGHPVVLADGDLVVAAWGDISSPETDDHAYGGVLLRLDPATGQVKERLDDAALFAGDPQTGPARYVVAMTVDPQTQEPIAVVHDWTGGGDVDVLAYRWTPTGLVEVPTS